MALRRGSRLLALLLAVCCVAAGCSSSSTSTHRSAAPASVAPSEPPVAPVRWKACGNGFQCGAVNVPLDYAVAGSRQLALSVTRRPASDPAGRLGVLIVDFGGPGISGASTLRVAAGLLPKTMLARFDLVGFDPRGSGASGPLRCDSGAGSAALVSAAVGAPPLAGPGQPMPAAAIYRQVYRRCTNTDAALVPTVASSVQARDLDRIRTAFGVRQLRYLGLSYGSVLGLAYAQQFPTRVAAMLLDSPFDPTQPIAELAREQASAAEQALDRAFAGRLPAGTRQQYDALARRLTRGPLPAPGSGDITPVSLGDLEFATLTYLQMPILTPNYPAALTSALAGSGKALRQLAAQQYEDVDGASLIGTYWATSCGDIKERPSPVTANTDSRALAAQYPRLGAVAYAFADGGCTVWPSATQPVTLPTTRLPIAILDATGNPIAPYAAAQRLLHELSGAVLITRVGEGHTAIDNGGGDVCLTSAESRFFLDPSSLHGPVRCIDPPGR